MSSLSVILPIYNEKDNIDPLLKELGETLSSMNDAEVIAVDDGSTDGTAKELSDAKTKYPFLRVVTLARNYGQTAALAAGMEHAKGDVLLPMDADGQNDPADIAKLLKKIDEGFDVVSGWRKNRKDALLRSLFSRVANMLIRRTTGQTIHDYGCTMKAYKREVMDGVVLYGDMHRFMAAYVALHGARVGEVVVHHRPRTRGVSKYGFSRIWRVILDLILLTFFLRSSTKPMQFFGGIGLIAITGGFITITAAVVWRLYDGPTLIETPLPVLSALLVIVGVQCVLMGVLAELAMRLLFQTHGQQSYKIRSVS